MRRALGLLFVVALACCGGRAQHAAPPASVNVTPTAERARPDVGGTCPASVAVVRSLTQPLHIVAYVMKGHPTLDAFAARLEAVLRRYQAANPARFDFAMVDATSDDGFRRARAAGLLETQFGEHDTKAFRGATGVVLDYGTEHEVIRALSMEPGTGLEYVLTTKVLEIRARGEGTKHRIGVLTGHGEIKLSEGKLVPAANPQQPNLQEILAKYFPAYVLVDVDLRQRAGTIDPSLDGLIITQPQTDLSDDELHAIDAFVMKNKTLAVFASAVNVAAGDPTMRAAISTHRLERLLGGYGIEMRADVIEEFGRPFRVEVVTPSGPSQMRFPAILDVKDDDRFTGDEQLLDATSPAFFRIAQIAFPFASSLVLHRQKQPDIDARGLRVLARSTPKSMRETAGVVDLAPLRQWRPKGEFGQYDVAAIAEGKLRSAFGTAAASRARVLVVSSAQFFANPFARASGGDETMEQLAMPYAQSLLVNTILVAKNTLDWLTMDPDLATCAALAN
jgi:hypothetical protein